jgi:hypothetical protein
VRRTNQPSALPRPKWTLGLGVVLAIGACLNPMPEEFPSERDMSDAPPTGAAGNAPSPNNGAPGSGGGAGSGGLTTDPGEGAGTGGSSNTDSSNPGIDDGGNDPDASPEADAGSEVGDAGP